MSSDSKKNIEKFEDLEVWQESMRLAVEIYDQLKSCKDFALRDQMHRAVISIPSNIAEGFERQSNKDYIRFLYISKGSTGELRTQLYLAIRLEIIGKEAGNLLIDKTRKISSILFNLIRVRAENFS